MQPASTRTKPEARAISHPMLRWFTGCAVLAALAFALYVPALGNGFLNYDDDEYVTANTHVQSGVNGKTLRWAFTNTDVGHWQPITWVTHMADCQLYGLNASGHHATNALFHAFNAVLLFAIFFWFTGAFGRSLLVAGLFAVHPVNVETVAWIAERKTLVCTLFTFLAVLAYGWYALRPNVKRYALVVLAFALALMSKSMAVTLPVLLLVLDYWPLGRAQTVEPTTFAAPRQSLRRLVMEKVPLLAMSGAVSLFTIHAQEKSAAVGHEPLSLRLPHVLWSFCAYIFKLAWPSELSVLYPYPVHGYALWEVVLAALGFILVSVVVWRARNQPYLRTGWLFYVIAILPVIGIIPVGHQSLADHYLYTPEIGIFLIAGWGAAALLQRAGIRSRIASLLGAAAVVAYASVTVAYLPSWKNGYTLFARAERLSPTPDFVIETNLGQGLNALGRIAEAVPHYQLAISLAPQMPLPHYNLGNALYHEGDALAAAAQFEEALKLSPDTRVRERCLNNLAAAQLSLNQLAAAESNFTAALALDPNSERSLAGRGQARARLQQFDGAIDDLQRATALAPDPIAYLWLGKALEARQQPEAAEEALHKALQLAPNLAEAQSELERISRTPKR